MTRQEKEPGHEKLIDYNFRIPSVEGKGAGNGFGLKDLILPEDYEESIEKLNLKSGIPKIISEEFRDDCRRLSLPQGFVEFKDNLLSQIVFGGMGYSPRLFLDNEHGYGTGIYRFENVEDIQTALVLAKAGARYMNLLSEDDKYAYVDCASDEFRTKYFSVGLRIPDDLAEKAKKTDNEFFRSEFAVEASNIAGRFGHAFKDRSSLKFENRFLQAIEIIESSANACYYSISRSSIIPNSYSDHNVDYPSQALALHGIAAEYINRLLSERSALAGKD